MNTGLIVTAIVAIIGVIKFKLIEELVKKITPENQNAKWFSIASLFVIVVSLGTISISLDPVSQSAVPSEDISLPVEIEDQQQVTKNELETKVDALKDGIEIAKELAEQQKEKNRKRDSAFVANRDQRWVYRIGDWTRDEDKILEMYKELAITDNIKLLKQGKKFLFIKDDHLPIEQLQQNLEQLRKDLNDASVNILDINTLLTRKKNDFAVDSKEFGRKRNKRTLEYLVAD